MLGRPSTDLSRAAWHLLRVASAFAFLSLLPGAAAAAAQGASSPGPAQPSVGTSQPQTPVPTAAEQQHTQKIQELINRAQASYTSGVNNYNNNRLDAARADFDAAVDAMLSSGMDLKNDPQLSDEFERLLDKINSLEIVALKQGNGFSPTLEAAPVDAAPEVTFAPDPELVGKVNAELKTTQSDLPLVINDYVAGWITAFRDRPALHAHLRRSIERAGKYKDMISRILRENGVPQDLIYQAVTESGFQPQVLNRSSGAAGMWQFMGSNDYLKRNGYFDERFDPEKSTIAYARFMKSLYAQFGDWYLAMAAYDWGPERVKRVVSRTGYADYWEIYRHGNLPAETKAYIPSVIAAIIMAKNPQQYGLTDVVPDAPVLSDTVTVDYAIDLKLVADLTDATVPEVVALNPALLRLSTPRDISYDLHLPPGTKETFNTRLKDIPAEDRSSWRFHVVKPGETLEGITASFHAHIDAVTAYNDVTPAKPIEVGDELVIPITANTAAGQQHYTVRRGDTFVTVADRFGLTVEQLQEWNGAAGSRLRPGRSIYVAEPVRLAPSVRNGRGRAVRGSSPRARNSGSAHGHGSGSARVSTHPSSPSPAHSAGSHASASKAHKHGH